MHPPVTLRSMATSAPATSPGAASSGDESPCQPAFANIMNKRLPLKVPSNICVKGGAACASVAFGAALAAPRRVLLIMVLLAAASGNSELPSYSAELPPSDLRTGSVRQAQGRYSEMLSNVPTGKWWGWKSGGGPSFCLHIVEDDSITMYQEGIPIMREVDDSRWDRSHKIPCGPSRADRDCGLAGVVWDNSGNTGI